MKILILGDNQTRCENYCKVLTNLGIDYDLKLEGDFKEYDRLIVPGGIDVDPDLYGEEKDITVNMIDREFDDIQIKAIKHFVDNKKPILGICRGMQLLNVYFNGSLIQDIKSNVIHRLPNHEDVYHEIKNIKNTYMYELYGDTTIANSLHHQAVKKLGDNLLACAKTDDGILEAAAHEYLPIIMVQFHPERMALKQGKESEIGYKIFNYFLNLK